MLFFVNFLTSLLGIIYNPKLLKLGMAVSKCRVSMYVVSLFGLQSPYVTNFPRQIYLVDFISKFNNFVISK